MCLPLKKGWLASGVFRHSRSVPKSQETSRRSLRRYVNPERSVRPASIGTRLGWLSRRTIRTEIPIALAAGARKARPVEEGALIQANQRQIFNTSLVSD